MAKRAGFTLIELSIVLIIVVGILVGHDLIRAAVVRAQLSQIEKYNTAVNTFYGKYGALPGDIPGTAASGFGFAKRGTGAGIGGLGDSNGSIEGQGNCATGTDVNGGYVSAGEPVILE